ncbi:MAG: hypothetical protein AB2689_15840 [Candidatus Thiodiazotropha taylori]
MNESTKAIFALFLFAPGICIADNNDTHSEIISNQITEDKQESKDSTTTGIKFSTTEDAEENAKNEASTDLDQFGFGPALFIIKYDKEVLKDSKEVKLRGDGTISANGSEYTASLGVELHYDFSFGHKVKCYSDDCTVSKNWNRISSHRISPYLGLFDIENGINGIAAGLIYGYTKADLENNNTKTLNFGVGWTVHKDRLVLSGDVEEGAIPPSNLTIDDYTERKDVNGLSLMVSVNFGF